MSLSKPIMENYFNLVYSGPEQVLPLVIGVLLWIMLSGVGIVFTNKHRFTEINIIFGWAIVSSIFVIGGVFFQIPFFILTILLAGISLLGIIKSVRFKQPLFITGVWKLLVLGMPLFLICGAMEPSQWDEFSHWLPAVKFLLTLESFPNAQNSHVGNHMFSAYPYGWPILSYISSKIAGTFLDNIGGILNLFLILTLTTFALRVAFTFIGVQILSISWGFAVAVILFSTIFNPTFIQKIVLTSYSDVSTAVVTGTALLVGYNFIEALGKRTTIPAWSCGWQLSLILMLLVNLRQTNIVLALLIILTLCVVAWRDSDIEQKQFYYLSSVILLGPLIIYLSWRFHVVSEFTNLTDSEAGFRPLSLWNFAEIPQIIMRMLYVGVKKIGFFGPMLLACYFAFRTRLKLNTPLDRIVIFITILFLGYNSFLLITYIGHFAPANAVNVVSYWRYNTHIGMIAVIFIITCTILFWNFWKGQIIINNWIKIIGVIIIIVLPLAFAHKIRFDREANIIHYKTVAKDVYQHISRKSNIHVMDPRGNGEASLIVKYYLNLRNLQSLSAFHNPSTKNIKRYMKRIGENDFVLVFSLVPGVELFLKDQLNPNYTYLLGRFENAWGIIHSWKKTKT